MRRCAVAVALMTAASLATPHSGVAQGAVAWTSEAASLDRLPGVLAGTLLMPHTNDKVPLVVIIAGSGPTDRNGNAIGQPGGSHALRQLAESLATRGIASMRYDKRGLGGSTGFATKEIDLRFEMLAQDAASWVTHYRRDVRFSKIVVLGHSEGALLGLIAAREAKPDAYVSLAGPSRRADVVLRDQFAANPQAPALMRMQADSIMDALVGGRAVTVVPPWLWSHFRPSVQPYLISYFRYTPAEEISRITIPCLVVQGTSDIQEAPSDARLLTAANPACDLLMVEGMNHVLKQTPRGRDEQMPSYFDPGWPLARGLVDGIAAFVRTVAKRP